MFSHDDQHREMPIIYQQRALIGNKININLIPPPPPHACTRDKIINSMGNSYYELKNSFIPVDMYTHTYTYMH